MNFYILAYNMCAQWQTDTPNTFHIQVVVVICILNSMYSFLQV